MSEEPGRAKDDLVDKIVNWSPESGAGGSQSRSSTGGTEEGLAMDRKIRKRRWPPRRIAGMALAGLFVGAVLYEFLLGDHSAKLNVKVERITISTVERGPFQEFIPVRGTMLPIQTIYLDALVGGQVEEVFVEEGSMVTKGEPLLRLSDPMLELSVMNQEAVLFEQINNMENTRINMEQQTIRRQEELINIEYQVQQARREYLRHEELMKRNLIARKDYAESKENYEYQLKRQEFMVQTVRQDSLYRQGQIAHMEASVKKLELNLKAVKRNLENLILKAPVSGQLTSLNAEIGELKSKGQRLGQVDVLDGFKARADIDEFYIHRINPGQTGMFDLAGKTYHLVIKKVYPEILDGRFEVDLEFAGEMPEDIRRGQTLHIRLALGDLSEAVLLARGGFYQTTGGNWVFVVDPSGAFAVRRPLRIGRQNPEFFEVLEGLEPEERVVTSSYEHYEEIEKLILKD